MKNAVILFSGGLDSTTCLAYAKAKGFRCYALSFNYAQKHSVELNAAKEIARHYEAEHIIVDLPNMQFRGSALTDPEVDVADYQGTEKIPLTYVPGRNTIFLAFALSWAEILKANAIFMGVSTIDYSCYPDCRPDYIQAFQAMANLATKTATEGNSIQIHTPLLHLSKADTIKLGLSLGVNYSITSSCYRPSIEGLACGTCDSCTLRKKGFAEAKVDDPTRYITSELKAAS